MSSNERCIYDRNGYSTLVSIILEYISNSENLRSKRIVMKGVCMMVEMGIWLLDRVFNGENLKLEKGYIICW